MISIVGGFPQPLKLTRIFLGEAEETEFPCANRPNEKETHALPVAMKDGGPANGIYLVAVWNGDRKRAVVNSLYIEVDELQEMNDRLQARYKEIQEKEVRYETLYCDDAEYLIVAFGSAARLTQKAIEMAREEGIKVGLLRPITLWPFPSKAIAEMAQGKKGVLVVEINAGQMVQDVRLAINGALPVEQFGRLGGIVPEPEEIIDALKKLI